MIYVLNILLGYLVGSISFSIIIGKCFYKIDVREHGSKNAGGTNVGRILGKRACVSVILLDALKIGISILITMVLLALFNKDNSMSNDEISLLYFIGMFFVGIGHCYPIYFNFKGGKAVSTMLGLLIFTNYHLLWIFVLVFAIILISTRMVSLGSMLASLIVSICSFIPFVQTGMVIPNNYSIFYSLALILFTLLLIFKHRSNIIRIIKSQERKVVWLDKLLKKIKISNKLE